MKQMEYMMKVLFYIITLMLSFILKVYAADTVIPGESGRYYVMKATPNNAVSIDTESYKYRMAEEADYTEQIWKEFYKSYPEYSAPSEIRLKDGLTKKFIKNYSITMDDFEEGNIFGGWEITEEDESGDIISHGVYAYGCIGRENKCRWYKLSNSDISTYAPYYMHHILSAEVVNGNVLRIHINVEVKDLTGGWTGRCGYQLSPDPKISSASDKVLNPWIEVIDSPRAFKGSLNVKEFSSKVSSSSHDRVLKFQADWDISGDALVKFKNLCSDNTLTCSAGFQSSSDSNFCSGKIECSNLAASVNKALCSHSSKRYEQINGNESSHNIYCSSCGLHLGSESHGSRNEYSRCTKCNYQFNVIGNIISKFNGYSESKAYSMKPGSYYIVPEVKGYIRPENELIPEKGGDINIEYQPVRYTVVILNDRKEHLYDSIFKLDSIKIKGMNNIGFLTE